MGTNNGGKIMVRYFILLVGVFCILSSCRNDMTEQEAALKKLVSDGTIERLGSGRKTHYVRKES